jgi:hypothetical protein
MNQNHILSYKFLERANRVDPYSGKVETTFQCSTVQICNFRFLETREQFLEEIQRIMFEAKTAICVVYHTKYFWWFKFNYFWKYSTIRVCSTGGGGTLWVIKRRF